MRASAYAQAPPSVTAKTVVVVETIREFLIGVQKSRSVKSAR